jgi:hypothetical protein
MQNWTKKSHKEEAAKIQKKKSWDNLDFKTDRMWEKQDIIYFEAKKN